METRKQGLSQVLNRISNAARDRAPLAAEFEDCTQRFDRLGSVMEVDESTWEPYQALLNDYRTRLSIWGTEVGSMTIDHTLRKSSHLRSQTLELLEHLQETLQNILDLVETTSTPMLAPPSAQIFGATSQSYFDLRKAGDDSLLGDVVLEKRIHPYIEVIDQISDSLANLVQPLQNPVPWDISPRDESGLQKEMERVKQMFGKAPPFLVRRLGDASWKRNLYLDDLREKANSMSSLPKRVPKREFRLPLSIPLKKNVGDDNVVTQQQSPKKVDSSYHAAFSRKSSTNYSMQSSIFSEVKPTSTIYSAPETSLASNAETSKVDHVAERYLVPKPPIPLQPNKPFVCPYCLQEIILGNDFPPEQEWESHIYMDIEPYICTEELCAVEHKTWGSRDDWFKHELHTHRIPSVYFCQSCELEFEKQDSLEQHLREVHDAGLQQEELAIIASMCRRYSQKPLESQICNICRESSHRTESLRDHLADHLEQLALTSVQSEDGFEEDIPLSPQFSDSGSERRFRLGLGGLEELELMVEEKIEPILQHNRDAPSNIPKIDISSIPGSAMRSVFNRPGFGKRGDSYTLTSRAKQFLDTQALTTDLSVNSSQDESMRVAVEETPAIATGALTTLRTGLAPQKVEFEGRIQDLKELHTRLSVSGQGCVLTGTGGIGKSALAAEYTYRCESEYSYIFWIQAETPIVCADAYGQIASKVVLKDNAGAAVQDQDRLIMLSQQFLQKTLKRWLLVFDNVDEWSDIARYLPTNFSETSGSVLITTRRTDLWQMAKWDKNSQIILEGLSLDESRRLLLKYTQPGLDVRDIRSHSEFKLAGDIAKLAERLPLALSLIAGYILVSRCSLTDFVELWDERRRNVQMQGELPASSTDAALETAWNLGLREVPPDARDLLNILAFLDPDTIQREMLVDSHEEKILELLHIKEAGRIKRMRAQLSQRKLITLETRGGEEIWSIHRTLQAKILQDLNQDHRQRQKVYTQAFLLIRKRFPLPSPIQVPEPSKWAACRRYLPHVLSLRKIFVTQMVHIPPSIELARLFSDGGIALWERSMTNEGLNLLLSAEGILDQLKCEEELLRANIHVIISLLLQDSGLSKLSECKRRISQALETRKSYRDRTPPEQYSRNDEILLYNAFSDYGCVLLQYNNFREAEPIFAACFEKYKSWGPPEEIPYEYSKYYHHMAFCLMYQSKFAEAIKLAEKGLHWVTVATGHSAAHNRWKFDLACIVLQSGDLKWALKLHQEILNSRIEQHGSSSFLALQSWYAVGATQFYLDELENAESSMRQVLSLKLSGSISDPVMARTSFFLSQILQQEGRNLDEARELAKYAKETLATLTEVQPLDALKDVRGEHELALFDHLQPVFDGRFTGRDILRYLSEGIPEIP